MSKIEQYSRVLHHRSSVSGQNFTIPVSNDHTDETWLATDLYIGEIGMNLADDRMYFRSNNGIIQLGTVTGSSTSSVWYQSGADVLLSTSTADSVSPNSTYYTDLGTTINPWKDLYLGSDPLTVTSISAGNGLQLFETNGAVLTSGADITSAAPIHIYSSANPVSKTRPLFLNSRYCTIYPSTGVVVSSSTGVIVGTGSTSVFIAGSDVSTVDNISNSVHLGYGFNKTNYNNNEVVVGNLAVRGTDDDGSGNYGNSDWSTSQSRMTTTDATTVDLAFIPWTDQTNFGEVIQVKAFVIGTHETIASSVYTCEISGSYYIDATGTASQVSDPVVIEMNSFDPTYSPTPPLIDMFSDNLGVYVKLTGPGSCIAKWLCTFSSHRLIKIYP
jgi:hypothetical protein